MQENKNNENESLAMYLVKEYAKQAKRLFVLLIISIIVNALIVGAFLVFALQFEIDSTEVQQDGYGVNSYIGGDGDYYGATNTQDEDNQT